MTQIALSIDGTPIVAPSAVPTGGLFGQGQLALQGMVGLFFIVMILAGLGFAIIAGIRWTMSEGKKEAIQQARDQLMYVVIGIVVIFLAIFIVKLVGFSLSVPLIHETTPYPDRPHAP